MIDNSFNIITDEYGVRHAVRDRSAYYIIEEKIMWNAMNINPIIPGVYELQERGTTALQYSCWNGTYWTIATRVKSNASMTAKKSVACYNGSIIGWREVQTGIAAAQPIIGTLGQVSNTVPVGITGAFWNSMKIEPPCPGIYQLQYGSGLEYSYWNGAYWSIAEPQLSTVKTTAGQDQSQSCYSGSITGWAPIDGTILPDIQPIAAVDNEFKPDAIKPELLSKRVRDWV